MPAAGCRGWQYGKRTSGASQLPALTSSGGVALRGAWAGRRPAAGVVAVVTSGVTCMTGALFSLLPLLTFNCPC